MDDTGHYVGNPGAKSVLNAVAVFADEHGIACPSHRTLAVMTDMTEKSVQTHLADLEDRLRLIERRPRFKENGTRTSDFILLKAPREEMSLHGPSLLSPAEHKPNLSPAEHKPNPSKSFPHAKGLDGLKKSLAGLGPFDSAREMHDAVAGKLIRSGYTIQREYPLHYREDGHLGYVDLIAEKDGCRFALELDRSTPRAKSIKKLQTFMDAARVVLLRGDSKKPGNPQAGLDAVLVLLGGREPLVLSRWMQGRIP